MADKHVRARCKTHGGIAAISARALDLGMFPDWERADGPVPKRPKSRVKRTAEPVTEAPTPVSVESEEE